MNSIYSIGKLQTFRSPDGGGFNATLLRDGRPVCEIHDGGHGGCYEYGWKDWQAPKIALNTVDYKGEPLMLTVSPEEHAFRTYVDSIVKDGYERDDSVIARMIDEADGKKRLARRMKQNVFFSKDGKDTFSIKLNGRKMEDVTKLIVAKHPKAVVFTTVDALYAHVDAAQA